jgi:membrane protein implicated in regulation of membrane protease activity
MGLRDRLSASAAEIKARSQRLVELNVELLSAELKRKGQQYGSAIGLFVGAGVLALYLLGFALATIAVVLYIWLPLWLSLLIVTAALLLIVLILALVGRSRMRKAKTLKPERAIAEAKSTADTLKTKMQETVNDLTPRRNGKGSRGVSAPETGRTPAPLAAPAPPSAGPPSTPPATPPSGPPPATPAAGPSATPPATPPSTPPATPPHDEEAL